MSQSVGRGRQATDDQLHGARDELEHIIDVHLKHDVWELTGYEIQEAEEKKLEAGKVPPDEEDDLWWYRQLYRDVDFEDDVRGGELDKELMIKARRAEIQFFKKLGVYSKVDREKHMKVITTKWVDTNKGDKEEPNYRARLVGR